MLSCRAWAGVGLSVPILVPIVISIVVTISITALICILAGRALRAGLSLRSRRPRRCRWIGGAPGND
jgi:hypothetical protein